MRDSNEEFRTRLDAARVWERRLAAWVRSRGWYVVPTYDFCGEGEGKAPKMLAPPFAQSLVLPDLQCFRDGIHQWLECKWKTEASFHRKTREHTTGISQRLHRHYLEVEQKTGAGVVLAFLHEREGEMRGAPLSSMGAYFSHLYNGWKMDGPMIFWKWHALPRWAPLAVLRARRS